MTDTPPKEGVVDLKSMPPEERLAESIELKRAIEQKVIALNRDLALAHAIGSSVNFNWEKTDDKGLQFKEEVVVQFNV